MDFELLEYLKQGLEIYTGKGEKIYKRDPNDPTFFNYINPIEFGEFPNMTLEIPENPKMEERLFSNMKFCIFKIEEVLNFGREHGLGPQDPQVHSTPETEQASLKPPISHSDGFRKIVKEGKEYTLTAKQARVIEILFNNFMKGYS